MTHESLPSGTITFVFTDIEGSTVRWDRDRAAMQDAVRRHDALIRATISTHRGHVFKTMGDAFCAAFARPEEAVAAMLAIQRGLGAEDFSAVDGLRVRVAMHTGTADERDGDYFGPAVNRVSRLLGIGHGGQILISGATAGVLQGVLPARAALRDLGEHRLRDLALPERVYQLWAPGLTEEFPPLKSLGELPNNLPRTPNVVIGRETEIEEIAGLVKKHQLVTVTGAGGVGKTRTALAVGSVMLQATQAGVWLVDLAPLAAGSFVTPTVAKALNVQESPNRPLLETLLAYLKQKPLLLILDNCEHVIAEAAALADALLTECPKLRILATSREPLQLAGEQSYRMPSLRVPSARDAPRLSGARAAEYASVLLFAQRAQASDRAFALNDENAPIVAEICRRLDGIPLAIELAAARVKVLSVRALSTKLDQRLRLLSSGDRTALPRQQTMRALIGWSYALLEPPEQRLFDRLSIFAGGCDLATATAVCADDGVDEFEILELLSSLVDKSLLVADLDGPEPRYRLLETSREYAAEKLAARGEKSAFALRHARAFLDLAERLEREYDLAPDSVWYARAEAELDNWRAALTWTLLDRGDIVLGQRLAGALHPVWISSFAEGRRWVNVALGFVDRQTPAAVVAQLEYAAAVIAELLAEYEPVLARSRRLITMYEELGDAAGSARAAGQAGEALVSLGRFADAEPILMRALAAARALGQHRQSARMLEALAQVRSALGNISEARAYIAEAIEIYDAIGDRYHAASAVCDLAEAEFRSGSVESAVALLKKSLGTVLSLARARTVGAVLTNLAAYLIACDQWDEAKGHALEALRLAQETQQDVLLACVLQHLVAIAVLSSSEAGDRSEALRLAARLLGYIDTRIASLGSSRGYTEEQEYDRVAVVLMEAMGFERLAHFMSSGAALSVDLAVEYASSALRGTSSAEGWGR